MATKVKLCLNFRPHGIKTIRGDWHFNGDCLDEGHWYVNYNAKIFETSMLAMRSIFFRTFVEADLFRPYPDPMPG